MILNKLYLQFSFCLLTCIFSTNPLETFGEDKNIHKDALLVLENISNKLFLEPDDIAQIRSSIDPVNATECIKVITLDKSDLPAFLKSNKSHYNVLQNYIVYFYSIFDFISIDTIISVCNDLANKSKDHDIYFTLLIQESIKHIGKEDEGLFLKKLETVMPIKYEAANAYVVKTILENMEPSKSMQFYKYIYYHPSITKKHKYYLNKVLNDFKKINIEGRK